MPKNLLAGAATFAHLIGRPAASKRAEDDKEREDPEDPKDKKDKEARAKRAEEDDKTRDEDENKKARAEDEDREDRDENKDRDAKKKSKARADDDGDDPEDKEDETDAKALAARQRERARCAAIFASPHAAARPDVAAHLAFGTGLSRAAALDVLAAVAAGEGPRAPRKAGGPMGALWARMDGQTNPNVGTPAEAPFGAPSAADPKAVAARMLASAARARGE